MKKIRNCAGCPNQKTRKIDICTTCLNDEMLRILPGSCPVCCAPAPLTLGALCRNCTEFESKGQNYIDDIIPITYGTKQTFISYMVRGHKYYQRNEYFVPLASVLFKFLSLNSKKIIKKFGNIDFFTFVPSYNDIRNHNKNLIHSVEYKELKAVDMLVEPVEHQKKQKMKMVERIVEEDRYVLADGYNINGKNILLYDDVCTSGSTIRSAAYTLKNHGANLVIGIVLFKQALAEQTNDIINYTMNHPYNYNEWKYDVF